MIGLQRDLISIGFLPDVGILVSTDRNCAFEQLPACFGKPFDGFFTRVTGTSILDAAGSFFQPPVRFALPQETGRDKQKQGPARPLVLVAMARLGLAYHRRHTSTSTKRSLYPQTLDAHWAVRT